MKNLHFLFACTLLFAACSSNEKMILVMSKGKANIDENAKIITIDADGSGHEEKQFLVDSKDAVTLTITDGTKKNEVSVSTNGLYIVNTKKDTIVGSYQNYNAPKEKQTVITQESMQQRIDSLEQLILGKNINAANKSYYLLPNTATKISDNIAAEVVGPFRKMTSTVQVGDKAPEVYRFYTVGEIREIIEKAKKVKEGKK
jgi:hypothetical protein